MAGTDRSALAQWVLDFTEAFNRDDLDGVMSCMADGAVYDEFNGTRSEGKVAIRAAFEPQFRGDFGVIRFQREDLILDHEAGKALISWTCSFQLDDSSVAWRGLDVLHFRDGLVTVKETYAKAQKPLITQIDPDAGGVRG